MGERFEIAVNPPECLEGAMMYLCLLAYPLAKDNRKRARLFEAFWAYAIRAARRHDRLRKGSSSPHSELLRKLPPQQMWGAINFANRRIWWRIVAAERFLFYGAMPTAKRTKKRRRNPADVNRDRFWIQNAVLPLPKGFRGERRYIKGSGYMWYVDEYEYTDEERKPTVTHVVQAISRKIAMPERNVWSQIVRPMRPVLHMADALRSTMLEQLDPETLDEDGKETSDGGFNCLTLIRRPDWVKRAVATSCTTAAYWDAYRDWPALRTIDPRDFIDVVARE